MLNPDDLPLDPADRDQGAEDFLTDEDNLDNMADFVIILGQLDPTEVDLTTGQPRWSESQRKLIIKANDILDSWRD